MRRPDWLSTDRLHRDLVGIGLDLLAVALAVIALLIAFGWHVDFGTLAEWVGGFGTVAAVSVALWMAGEEARRHDRAEKRKQADLIAAWISGWEPLAVGPAPPHAHVVVVSNASAVPIYDVVATIVYKPRSGTVGEDVILRTPARTIPSGDHKMVMQQSIPSGKVPDNDVVVDVAFTDAGGNHWRRAASGALRELATSAIDEIGPREQVKFQRIYRIRD